MAKLEVGDVAPDFTLPAAGGGTVTLTELRSGAENGVIIYFYPAAGTPGCTTQACDFRDNLASLGGAGYVVLGVSKDSVEKLKAFQEEDGLTFPLLSDPELTVHQAYGAYGEKNSYGRIVTGVLRSTFVIDETGTLTLARYNVKATGHVKSLRKALGLDA